MSKDYSNILAPVTPEKNGAGGISNIVLEALGPEGREATLTESEHQKYLKRLEQRYREMEAESRSIAIRNRANQLYNQSSCASCQFSSTNKAGNLQFCNQPLVKGYDPYVLSADESRSDRAFKLCMEDKKLYKSQSIFKWLSKQSNSTHIISLAMMGGMIIFAMIGILIPDILGKFVFGAFSLFLLVCEVLYWCSQFTTLEETPSHLYTYYLELARKEHEKAR